MREVTQLKQPLSENISQEWSFRARFLSETTYIYIVSIEHLPMRSKQRDAYCAGRILLSMYSHTHAAMTEYIIVWAEL